MRSRIIAFVFFLVLFLSFPAWAQTFQLFNSPHQQFLDTSGRPLAGGQIFTYAAGTTTPQTTFKDSGGTTPNTNPIVLDSGGFGTIYLNTTLSYKVVLKNAQGVQQWSVDNIAGTTGTISTVPLNSILPATGTNAIDNGNNTQAWRWQATGAAAESMFGFGETAASTNSAPNSSLLSANTFAGSTIRPFQAVNGNNGLIVLPNGDIKANGTATFLGPLTGNVTGNVSGTAGSLAGTPTQCTTVTQYASGITATGNANCNPFTAVFAAAPPITGTTATFSGAVSTGPLTSTTGTFSGAVTAASLKATGLAGTPSCVQTDANGQLTAASGLCGTVGGPASSAPLSGLTVALANNTISNASWTQTWNWVLTGANNGMVIGETSAGAGTGALVQINGLSNAVTPLDVESAASSQIHFGTVPATGGWLTHFANNGEFLTLNAALINNAWTAKSTSPSLFGVLSGRFEFDMDTGKTPGSTFTPTTLETIAPLNGRTVHTLYAGGNPFDGMDAGNTNLDLYQGWQFDGSAWTARQATPSLISMSSGVINFYSDNSRTVGTIYAPTFVGSIANNGLNGVPSINTPGNTTTGSLNVTTNSSVTGTESVGRLQVTGGVTTSNGIKIQRSVSCTTTAVANGNCSGTLTWGTAFADSSYTVVCNPVSGGAAIILQITSIAASNIGYALINGPANASASAATLECIAMHD